MATEVRRPIQVFINFEQVRNHLGWMNTCGEVETGEYVPVKMFDVTDLPEQRFVTEDYGHRFFTYYNDKEGTGYDIEVHRETRPEYNIERLATMDEQALVEWFTTHGHIYHW